MHIAKLQYFFRTALAALHFNENIRRESQKSKDDVVYTNVLYPKYKLGEEVVREVKKPPTYGKYYNFINLVN